MLQVDVYGKGPDLVLLHGWGMHGGLFADWARELGAWFRVTVVDLPGHGNSRLEGRKELRDWAAAVLEVVPANAWCLGWSLGGLVALAAASMDRTAFRGLILLASTPRFVKAGDWPQAVDAGIFQQFAQQLEDDVQRTLSRFLSLQVRGSDGSGDALRRLRSELKQRSAPDVEALRSGLRFLQQTDARDLLESPGLPLFWMLGERDTLVPAAVAEGFAQFPAAVIAGAGHAPFLSHPKACAAQLKSWLLKDGGNEQAAAG